MGFGKRERTFIVGLASARKPSFAVDRFAKPIMFALRGKPKR